MGIIFPDIVLVHMGIKIKLLIQMDVNYPSQYSDQCHYRCLNAN